MPSLVVLQSPHNDIFDFLIDEAARFFVHFVTHYGSAFSPRFCKGQSAVLALFGYALLCSAKPTCAMLRVFLSDNHFCLLVSGCGISRNLKIGLFFCSGKQKNYQLRPLHMYYFPLYAPFFFSFFSYFSYAMSLPATILCEDKYHHRK